MIYLILGTGLLLRLVNLNQSFWLDEAAQALEAARPFSQQLRLSADFHPPLFHLMLHFWMYLGRSEIWIRFLSVFFGMGSLVLLYKLVRVLGNKEEGFLAILFLTISPYHIWYSQEARSYMLFVFLSLFSTLALLKKQWVLYILFTVLSLYSFYFALFFIFGHAFYIFFMEKRCHKQFFFSLLVSLLLFLPWAPSLIRQLAVGTSGAFVGWTGIVSVSPLKAIPLTFAKFIMGRGSIENNLVYGMVVSPIFLLFIISIFKTLRSKSGKILTILFFVPFVAAVSVSFITPVIAPQRLIFLLPIFLLILAKGIYKFSLVLRIIAIFAVCVISISGVVQYWFSPYVQREQWRQAVSFVERTGDNKSIALFVFPSPFASYSWYRKGTVEATGIAPKFNLRDEDLVYLADKLSDKNKIYLFQYLTGLTDPQEKTRHFLPSLGFREAFIKDFPGVGFIYVYEKV